MKRYGKVVFWSVLLAASLVALVLAVLLEKRVQLLPAVIAVVFTAIQVVREAAACRRKT